MKIAVLSGKGGAGKTFTAVNLAVSSGNAVYIDCDVEEPNGRLFLKPERTETQPVYSTLPVSDAEKCIGCRKCTEVCRFNALVFIKKRPRVFPDVCHSCGACSLVCPAGAVKEEKHEVGQVETGYHGGVRVVTGVLNLGEASGSKVISAALKTGKNDGLTIIDCPPGSACPVMESIEDADCCILAAEPTAFGFHNFKMVYELTQVLGKPCSVIINRITEPYEPLEEFCREHSIPVLLRIPYSARTARLGAEGKILAEEDPEARAMFAGVLEKIGGGMS